MLNDIIKKVLKEATSVGGSRGSYIGPLTAGLRPFKKEDLSPFNIPVSDYYSPLVQYDSYDKSWDLRRNQIKELEKQAAKITNFIKKHPELTSSDEEGNIINPTPGKGKRFVPLKENSTSSFAGEYTAPLRLGSKKWEHQLLAPFTEFVDMEINHKKKQKKLKNNIKKEVDKLEEFENKFYDVSTLNEDLAVWFGTKKKPKGSKQPKGPWVDICRKVNGKHPPCGRKDTDTGSYPKCRAAGVAGKMSDSAKKAACQQKRRAEKKDTQTGKGQKPIMTSYKPRKKNTNENIKTIRITESELINLIKKVLNENY